MDMLMRSVTRAAKVATGSSRGGARVSARILARHDMHGGTSWASTGADSSSGTHCNSRSVPHINWPDIVEPVAVAAAAPAVFAEATGFVALLQNLMQRQKRSKVRTSDYYQGSG